MSSYDEYVMGAVLSEAEEVSRGHAQMKLLKLAVEKAEKLNDDALSSSQLLQALWRLVLQDRVDGIFEMLLNRFKLMSPRLLESTIKMLSLLLRDTSLPNDRKAMLVTILRYRTEWLASQIRVLEKPFTWEMPVAEFPDLTTTRVYRSDVHMNASKLIAPKVQAFLRGSDEIMTTEGLYFFSGRFEAGDFASFYEKYHHNASLDIHAGPCASVVTISKTRKWYTKTLKKLPQLKEELKALQDITTATLVAVISGSKKRDRTRRTRLE